MALKANQPSLYEDVQWLFEQALATQFQDIVYDFHQTLEQGHGQVEIRRCWTLSELAYLVQKPHWSGLAVLAIIQSEHCSNGKVAHQTRYFISSLTNEAKPILAAVRSHWAGLIY